MMNFLQQLLGALGSAINQAKSQHISKSVLNKDKVNEALKKYSNEASVVKKKKKLGKKAVDNTNNRPPQGAKVQGTNKNRSLFKPGMSV